MAIYQRRTPTLFASRKDGVKEAAYNTKIQTDLIHQDPKYCRPFMETPEMRDCLSRIAYDYVSSIMFSLIPFFSFSRQTRGYAGVTGPTSDLRKLSVIQSSLSLPSTHSPNSFPNVPASSVFQVSLKIPPRVSCFQRRKFLQCWLRQGCSNRTATYLSPVDSTRHFTLQPPLLR